MTDSYLRLLADQRVISHVAARRGAQASVALNRTPPCALRMIVYQQEGRDLDAVRICWTRSV